MPTPSAARIAAIKKKLLEDPNTQKIAEQLGMTFEAYVESVMKFVEHPAMQPMVTIVPDADLRAAGYEPPDLMKMKDFIQGQVDEREATRLDKSKFVDPDNAKEKVTGKIPAAPPATARPEEVRSDLKADLERERTSGKLKKV